MTAAAYKKVYDKKLGPLTILFGRDNGKYPQGNSLLIEGANQTVLVDPGLGMLDRQDRLPKIDGVWFSHIHEDHVAGLHLFPGVPCACHVEDSPGIRSLNGMLDIYGFEGEFRDEFEQVVVNDFHFVPRESPVTFENGHKLDLGGVTLEVLHTPGHTRGHSCFVISWEGSEDRLVYLGDIELTGFGPYYGDAWSSLVDFESSLKKLEQVDANLWLTFHHKGLIEGRDKFLAMLKDFTGMISRRENNLLDYLAEPRTLTEIVAHRFVYRPGTPGAMVDQVERRSMGMHLDRLLAGGQVVLEQERYHRA